MVDGDYAVKLQFPVAVQATLARPRMILRVSTGI